MPNQHIVPHKDGWAVKPEGGNKPTKVTDTKQEAVKIGREIAKNQGTELVIHGKDGKIQSKDSHGRDPYPPRG
ncbi:DUF2188 domain-containing protein [Paenibacillus phocaensis]|uniref:DUF2188 domain-containing protein n=1 Tax=Paenibacillus phocaensis TaxID=1776378 RepID=UPI000B1B3F52|nr:DUF2188 domain-containing protein [Paenibacillus phocaensis]